MYLTNPIRAAYCVMVVFACAFAILLPRESKRPPRSTTAPVATVVLVVVDGGEAPGIAPGERVFDQMPIPVHCRSSSLISLWRATHFCSFQNSRT